MKDVVAMPDWSAIAGYTAVLAGFIYEIGVEDAMRTRRRHGARYAPVAGKEAILPSQIALLLRTPQNAGSSITSC
jgi:hypothetical protein